MKYICHCGALLRETLESEESLYGILLGYPIWVCDNCGETFDERDLIREVLQTTDD